MHEAMRGHIETMTRKCPDLRPLADTICAAAEMLAAAVNGGGKILAAGNGGSCSDALHFSGELLKSFLMPRPVDAEIRRRLTEFPFGAEMADALEAGIPAVVLGQNPAISSAYLNDRREVRAFLAQECLALARPGDVLTAFSTSGEAENLIWAMAAAKAKGAKTIAFTGKSGGRMGPMADLELRAPAKDTATTQEQHVVMYHALCGCVESRLFGR